MQQPPNPYPQYPQQQWQQPPMPPQQPPFPPQQYQQPPQYQPPMPPLPKKKSRKRLWLILAAAILVLAVVVVVASQGQSQQLAPTTQATQQTQATQPTTAPTHPVANAGPTILGANISAFIAKYGQPNSSSGGGYNFALYGNPTHNDLSVTSESNKALAILKDSPTDQGWNETEAIAACLIFTPQDTIYKRSMTLLDPQGNPTDIQRVYYSPSLAKQFPASDFTDENGNQTTPGTFGIVLGYNLGSTTSFLTCSAQVGLQQK